MAPIKKLILSLKLVSFSFSAIAQANYDERIKANRTPECADVSNEISILFAGFMKAGQVDSAKSVLDYWEKKCGINEVVFRAKLMFALKENLPVDSIMGKEPMRHIMQYSYRASELAEKDQVKYDSYKAYYGFVPPGQEFDNYSLSFFSEQKKKHHDGEFEYLLAAHYAGLHNTLFHLLQEPKYSHTRLARDYFEEVNEYKNKPETHLAAFGGVWMPTGGAKLLGVHPQLGFQGGAKYKRLNFDITIAVKFLKSATPYLARRTKYDNSLVLTDKFLGGYIGIDGGYDVYRFKNNETQLLAGFGGDGFDALKEDKSRDIDAESVWSTNFNLGAGHRYYLSNDLYLGLQVKYHIVDYTANNVVNFTGNPITIVFIVGGLTNYRKEYVLKRLQYDWRK